MTASRARATGATGHGFELCVTFLGMLPDEELVGMVKRLAQRGGYTSVATRIEQLGHGRYRVRAHHAGFAQSYEHESPSVALCGAWARLEQEVLAGWPYPEHEAAE